MVHCMLGLFTFVRQMFGIDIGSIHHLDAYIQTLERHTMECLSGIGYGQGQGQSQGKDQARPGHREKGRDRDRTGRKAEPEAWIYDRCRYRDTDRGRDRSSNWYGDGYRDRTAETRTGRRRAAGLATATINIHREHAIMGSSSNALYNVNENTKGQMCQTGPSAQQRLPNRCGSV